MNALKALDPEPNAAGKRSTIHRPPSTEVFDRKKTRINASDNVTVSSPRIPLYNSTTTLLHSVTQQPFISTSFLFNSHTQLPTVHNPSSIIPSSFSSPKAALISRGSPSISDAYSSPCKESSFVTSSSNEAIGLSTFIKERKQQDRIVNEEHARKDIELYENEIMEHNRILQKQSVNKIDLEDPVTVIDDNGPVMMDETRLCEKEDIAHNFKYIQKNFVEKTELAAKKVEYEGFKKTDDKVVKKNEAEVKKKTEANSVEKTENEAVEKAESEVSKKAIDDAVQKVLDEAANNMEVELAKISEMEATKMAEKEAKEKVKKKEEAEVEAAGKAKGKAESKERFEKIKQDFEKRKAEAYKAETMEELLDLDEIEEVPVNTRSIQELEKFVKEKNMENESKAEKLKEVIVKENEKKKMTEAARAELMELKQEEVDKKRMAATSKLEREREEESIAQVAMEARRIRKEAERLERELEDKLEAQRMKLGLEEEELKRFQVDLKAAKLKLAETRFDEDRWRVSRLKLTKEREDIEAELNQAEKELSALKYKSDVCLEKDDNDINNQDLHTSVKSVVQITDSPQEKEGFFSGSSRTEKKNYTGGYNLQYSIIAQPTTLPKTYSASSLLREMPSLPDSIESQKPFEGKDSFEIEDDYGFDMKDTADFSVPAIVKSPSTIRLENSEWTVGSNPFLEISSPIQQLQCQNILFKSQDTLPSVPSQEETISFARSPPQLRRPFSKKRFEYAALPRTPLKDLPRSPLHQSITASRPVVGLPLYNSLFKRRNSIMGSPKGRNDRLSDSPLFPDSPVCRQSPTRHSNEYRQDDENKLESVVDFRQEESLVWSPSKIEAPFEYDFDFDYCD